MKVKNRVSAALLAAVLLLTLAFPAAASEEPQTISIRTAQDLAALSKSCTLDSWSQGKTVLLEENIDLTGISFAPIPTFGGTFDGQGHTISGLDIGGSGDTRGLFRYIQTGGVVKNLSVIGEVSPSGHQDVLGGIVGSNSGKVAFCNFQGTVTGENTVGGIAGSNEAGGQIINCTFSGTVSGEHSVGGVAGQNLGSIVQCQNNGRVNTTDMESAMEKTVELSQLNSTENFPGCVDIGGIAGFSSGIIQSCQNTGDIGYEHTGYNVGGIAGRSSGYLDGCVNSGAVQGRQDVGGIVGQLEPELVQSFSEDFLDQLLEELDTLQSLMDRTLKDADRVSSTLSSQLHDLSDSTRTVQDAASGLTDALTDWTNGNIDEINEISARLSWTLNQLEPILGSAENVLKDLQDTSDLLDGALDDAYEAADLGNGAIREMIRALDDLQTGLNKTQSILPGVRTAMSALRSALGDEELTAQALTDLANALENFQSAAKSLQNSCTHLSRSLNTLEDAGDSLMDAMEGLMDASGALDHVLSGLTGIAGDLHDMTGTLADMPVIELDPIGSSVTDRGDDLDEALTGLIDSFDSLTDAASSSSQTLTADLRAINRQFSVILTLIRNEKADWEAEGDLKDHLENLFVDVSDQGDPASQTAGRVSASQNSGTVLGDTNVSGIAGTIAVEYDYHSEDDLNESGSRSLSFRYQARALLLDCVNTGAVTAKRDYAGGVVGYMALGLATGCRSYGPVASTNGSYVGGIAGASYAAIRDGWAKCALSGEDYVGGIAGLGSTIVSSHTLIDLEAGSAYLGAIAGNVEEGGQLLQNTFTHETLAGVDGVSYSGKAEPVSFDGLCSTPGAPEDFAQFILTFVADGTTVAVVPFQYGEGLDSLPEIPDKEGYSGAWPDMDYSRLTFSYVLEAQYTPHSPALSDGSGLPQILVDGSFSKDALVSYTTGEAEWTDSSGQTYSGTAYTVTVDDPVLTNVSYTVHYRLPDSGKRYTLWVLTGQGWESRDYALDGSYLLLSGQNGPLTFCVVQKEADRMALAAAAGGAVIVLAGAVTLLIRKKKKAEVEEPSEVS